MPTGTSTPPGPLTLEIARIIRSELARQQISKTTFAERVGTVSRAQINKMINGQKPIDIEDLDRMALALDMSLVKLIRDAEHATQERHLNK